MLWTAPPLLVSAMEVGTIILLEICAAHESLRGPLRHVAARSLTVAFGAKRTFGGRPPERIY
jgi:hypothetical protein